MTALKLRVGAAGPLTAADHDENMLRLYGFPTLAEMLADDDRDYTFYAEGATVFTIAEGYRYEVAASGATDHHLITAADLKLYVLPSDDGSYNLGAFNPAGDDATDDHAVFKLAFEVAQDNVLHFPQRNYYLSEFLEAAHYIHVIGHGAKLRFPAGTTGIINKSTYSAGTTGLHGRNMTGAELLTYQSGLVKYAGNVYRPSTSGGTITSAQLAAEEPGTGSRWVLVRAVETPRDDTVPTWTGAGGYATMSYDPAHATHHAFLAGTYVICRDDDVAYLVAELDAVDHDEETMFGVKLYTLDPATDYYPVWDAANLAVFEDFTLDGTEASGDLADGFRMRAPAVLRNITVENFSRHGINAQAAVPQAITTSPGNWGNVNRFYASDCITRYNGDCGWLSRGNDGNAGLVTGHESYGNGRVGIYDNSFLGNTFVGCRTYGNGNGVATGNIGGMSSVVSHEGNLYQAKYDYAIEGVPQEQLDLYVSTEPGDNVAVWELIGVGDPTDEFPAWQAGQSSGFYFHGCGLKSTNTNARSTWVGCSSGEDEGGNVFQGSYILNIGGYQPLFNIGGQLLAEDGGALKMTSVYAASHPSHVWLCKSSEEGNILAFNNVAESSAATWTLKFHNGDLKFSFAGDTTNAMPFRITDTDTPIEFGTGAPVPYVFHAQRGVIIGASNNGRRHDTMAAAPTTGTWARGDVVYCLNPSAGGNVGWICVTAGTPGTWKAFGSIAS